MFVIVNTYMMPPIYRTLFETVLDFLTDRMLNEPISNADAIFVFGHTDPRLAIYAADLYKEGKAKKIILTGKGRKNIQGFNSEADYYAALLEKEGIPRSSLILENQSMNSLENVLLGIKICRDIGFYPASLIIVAMPPLLRRSRATFEKQFPKIKTHSCGPAIPGEEYQAHAERIFQEFDRFDEYAKKGDIASIAIPRSVQEALQIVRRAL